MVLLARRDWRETRDSRESHTGQSTQNQCLVRRGILTQLSPVPLVTPVAFHIDRFFRFRRKSIQNGFKLQASRFERLVVRFARDPERISVEKHASRKRKRDHVAIPAREEFFFEQAKARGTIGRPVAFAKWMTPSFTTWRGPLGPSGVTTTSRPDRPNLMSARSAPAPPRVLDPRTASCPNRAIIRAMISPSPCLLINTWEPAPR
jgi:hypothetical protein